MKNNEPVGQKNQTGEMSSLLEEIIREGARKIIQAAILVVASLYF